MAEKGVLVIKYLYTEKGGESRVTSPLGLGFKSHPARLFVFSWCRSESLLNTTTSWGFLFLLFFGVGLCFSLCFGCGCCKFCCVVVRVLLCESLFWFDWCVSPIRWWWRVEILGLQKYHAFQSLLTIAVGCWRVVDRVWHLQPAFQQFADFFFELATFAM